MSQEYTISALTNRNKPDKFGNPTFMVKFAECAETAYAAFKTEPKVGDKKYGDINEGDYGSRFKSAQRPDGQPFTPSQNYSPQPQAGRKSDTERSEDIRWGLCIKEANAYVCSHDKELKPDKWADAVIERATALYKVSGAPDVLLTEDEEKLIDGAQVDLSDIPF